MPTSESVCCIFCNQALSTTTTLTRNLRAGRAVEAFDGMVVHAACREPYTEMALPKHDPSDICKHGRLIRKGSSCGCQKQEPSS